MSKTAIIFIGNQASGKTTYYQTHFSEGYGHINLDELHTRNKEMQLLNSSIDDGKSFVIDNTNPTKEERAKYIEPAKQAGYRVIGYFFQSRVRDCIERNSLREGKQKVAEKAIAATSNKLEMPSWDEGFDEIYYVSMSEDGTMLKQEWWD